MRRKTVAGNWKLNLSSAEAYHLASELKISLEGREVSCRSMVFPSSVYLSEIGRLLQGTAIGLGAQDCSRFSSGAYTGEVSASQLASVGVEYVLIGHSERRQYFGESDETLLQKMLRAHESGLSPVFCVGESLPIRESAAHLEFVASQLEHTFFKLSAEQQQNTILAYEPVWAIGTGRTATAEQAQEMHRHLRAVIARRNPLAAETISILYGGSCNPANAAELFACEDVDGGLIGGASLKPSDFMKIIDAA